MTKYVHTCACGSRFETNFPWSEGDTATCEATKKKVVYRGGGWEYVAVVEAEATPSG